MFPMYWAFPVLDMGTEAFVVARRANWLDGGVFTRTWMGTMEAKAGGHRLSTARNKERGMRGFIRKAEVVKKKTRQQKNGWKGRNVGCG
jgi:hypothetical protein